MLLLLLGLCVRAAPPLPEESECFTVNGRDYRGNTDRAGPEGIPCLYWNQTHQHHYSSRTDPTGELGLGDHNHCRNPDSDVQPWCYVSETEEGVYWKYCDIPSCHMPGYLGCFLDPGSPPGLTGPSGTSAKLTVQTCIQFCRSHGFQYAGLEAGYACFCGGQEDAAVLQEGGASRCDQMCFGRPSELCGGDGALSVYAVWVGSCGGNLSSSGVLYSPNYPDEYGAGRTCTWEIRSPGSVAVEMKFPSFHVEDPGDVLEVSDGQSGMPLMVIRGGQDVPSALSFPTAHLRITFISNQARGGAGFVLLYTGLGKEPPHDNVTELDLGGGVTTAHPTNPHTERSSIPPLYCQTAWILLLAALALLAITALIFLCRRALVQGLEAEPSYFLPLYRRLRGRGRDLAGVTPSSMKSLL